MRLPFNQTAAVLLGAAIKKTFPHVEFEGSHVDPYEFRCAFFDKEPFDPSYLHMLENVMKELAGEPIESMEMVASNAAELFSHHNQELIAKKLRGQRHIVSVAKLGGFVDLAGELEDCKTFTLFGFEQKKGRVEVFGAAFETDRQKRAFQKKFREYSKKNSGYLAKELDLYEEETWHPRGMTLKRVILDKWHSLLSENGYGQVSTENIKNYFELTKRKQFYCLDEGADSIYCFDGPTSLLLLLEKWIKIFGFDHQWVLHATKGQNQLLETIQKSGISIEIRKDGGRHPRLELCIADGLGRYWPVSKLQLEKGWAVGSLFGDLNQFIAFLLEKSEGDLPFWLAPEQVVLISLEGVDESPVIEILKRHGVRLAVDRSDKLLKEKLHRALRLKVPYVMVFGKREELKKEISVRAYGSSQDMKMTFNEIETLLAERQIESQ